MEAASKQEPQWTGTHVWTIDYLEMHQRAKAKRGSWHFSDPFTIGGHSFTMMVNGDGFEKGDHTPFGVFMCPSKDLSGCLLTSFKIHLSFPGSDPLPSGQLACKDFWEDEQKGGSLGYNWGFQVYSPSVTHRDLHDKTSPLYQASGGRPVIIVELYLKICKDYEDFIQENIARQYSGDQRKETGHVGIKNQGATCYLNSLMQALYHTAFLRDAVFQIPSEAVQTAEVDSDSDDDAVGTVGAQSSKKKSKVAVANAEPAAPVPDSVVLALQRVFYRLQFSQSSVGTKELTRSFGWDARESFTQHDVQELDRVLCDNLETKMKGTPGENALKWLFCGKMRNYIRCCNVDYKSERIEVFYDLSLNVKGIPNIIGSFRQYVEAEKMQGDNKYKPNDELGYQDADRGTEFAEFPAVLHLHLKRFEYDWERDCMAKINDRYEFFETIDLSEFCPVKEGAEPGPPNVYKLHSVMVHSGDVFGGHYYAYIRPKCTGDEWFKFDDDRVSVATPDQAIDSNFGVTPSQATVGFKRCSNAYMLVYVREADLPVVCKDVPLESVPLALRQRFDAEQALDQQKQKKKLEERFNVSVNYCIEDDLKGILGKGLLPDDHRFRSLVIRKSATVAALRTEFASSLKCDPSEVVLLNYRSHAAKHATSVRHQFDKSYDNNDEPVFRLLDREKGNQWDPMIVYACRQRDVANTKFGIKHVVVIKVYDVATSTSKFLGLLNLNTSTFNEIAANVRELLDASGEEPYLPNFRLFLEPAFIRDDAEELTADSQGLQTPVSPGSVIVAEVMKQETPSYVPGEFMQHYRNVDNMVTLELRHSSSPGEDVHPTFKHKCLRTELCQDIVEMIAQRYGLNASHVRLLQHDFAFNVPKKNFGFSQGGRAVELMFEFNRKLLKEHVLHFEVLTFDVAELQTKKPMKVFICTPSVNEHVTDLLPFVWTAAQICQHYQEKYPSLAAENLRVLLVGGNRLTEQLSGFNRILDKASIDDIRIEVVPPSHTELPPCSGLVPVQLFNKNAGSYLLSSLIPHPFYIRVDPGCTASAILREISTEMQRLIPSTRARAESPPPAAATPAEPAAADSAAPAAPSSAPPAEVSKSVVVRGKTPEGHSFRVMLWAFNGNKSLSLGPDDVILDKMGALADMCVTQWITKNAAFDSISVLCEVSGVAVSHAIKIHN